MHIAPSLTVIQAKLVELEKQFLHAPAETEPALRELVQEAELSGDWQAQAHALILLGGTLFYLGRFPEGREANGAALALARREGHRALESRALNGLAIIAHKVGHYREAFEHYRQSIELSRLEKDSLAVARTLSNLAYLYRIFRQFDQAMTYLNEAQDLLIRYHHPTYAFNVSTNLAWTHVDAGNYRQALAITDLFLPATQEAQALKFTVLLRSAQAICYLNLGQLTQGLGSALKAVADVEGDESIDPDGLSYGALGQVKLALHDYEAAEHYLLRALNVANRSGSVLVRADIRAKLAWLYEKSGDSQRAHEFNLQFFAMQEKLSEGAMQG